ncbi:hypothetical protein BDZ89DRAFT_1115752 [Hymenopellis radicata]|nr:hypothetical protein BDZ89DRAFT_1115752 [Hymenopellis radicata]
MHGLGKLIRSSRHYVSSLALPVRLEQHSKSTCLALEPARLLQFYRLGTFSAFRHVYNELSFNSSRFGFGFWDCSVTRQPLNSSRSRFRIFGRCCSSGSKANRVRRETIAAQFVHIRVWSSTVGVCGTLVVVWVLGAVRLLKTLLFQGSQIRSRNSQKAEAESSSSIYADPGAEFAEGAGRRAIHETKVETVVERLDAKVSRKQEGPSIVPNEAVQRSPPAIICKSADPEHDAFRQFESSIPPRNDLRFDWNHDSEYHGCPRRAGLNLRERSRIDIWFKLRPSYAPYDSLGNAEAAAPPPDTRPTTWAPLLQDV